MKVSVNSLKMNQKKVRTNMLKSSKPITILVPTDSLDYSSIKTGLMPNFIHSLDASNIHMLINLIIQLQIKNMNLYTIHDCFATDYKNIALLEILIKKSFTDIYFNKKYLDFIHECFLKQIESMNTIFTENKDGNIIKYILLDPKFKFNSKMKLINKKTSILKNFKTFPDKIIRIDLPQLPDYNWEINKDIINKEIMFNQYLVS